MNNKQHRGEGRASWRHCGSGPASSRGALLHNDNNKNNNDNDNNHDNHNEHIVMIIFCVYY